MTTSTATATRSADRPIDPVDRRTRPTEPSPNTGHLRDLVSPGVGLVSRVHRLPSAPGDPPYPVCAADLGDVAASLPHLAASPPQVEQPVGDGAGPGAGIRAGSLAGRLDGAGGGIDEDTAGTIAIAEALERYSTCVYDERQFRWATADELGTEALDLGTLPRCSPAELAHPRCPVTVPDPAAPIRWVRGVDLGTGEPRWVPAVLVYLHIPARSPGERFTTPISTGAAAHPDLFAALRNAACEVIERDAISLTWLQRLPLPRIELDAVPGWLRRYLEVAADRDVTTHLFDATTDLGIPTVYAVEVAPAHESCRTVVMCATELDPRRAVAKVLREAASGRIALQATRPRVAEPDDFATVYDGAVHMGRPERADAFDFLLRSPNTRALSAMPVLGARDTREELRVVLDRLAALGLAAYAVDLTTDEAVRAGMHVVRVIIPGLQPLSFSHRARYLGHPRLYRAPARMGYPAHPESGINPSPQPFA